jgi:hypothetical protein
LRVPFIVEKGVKICRNDDSRVGGCASFNGRQLSPIIDSRLVAGLMIQKKKKEKEEKKKNIIKEILMIHPAAAVAAAILIIK